LQPKELVQITINFLTKVVYEENKTKIGYLKVDKPFTTAKKSATLSNLRVSAQMTE